MKVTSMIFQMVLIATTTHCTTCWKERKVQGRNNEGLSVHQSRIIFIQFVFQYFYLIYCSAV